MVINLGPQPSERDSPVLGEPIQHPVPHSDNQMKRVITTNTNKTITVVTIHFAAQVELDTCRACRVFPESVLSVFTRSNNTICPTMYLTLKTNTKLSDSRLKRNSCSTQAALWVRRLFGPRQAKETREEFGKVRSCRITTTNARLNILCS